MRRAVFLSLLLWLAVLEMCDAGYPTGRYRIYFKSADSGRKHRPKDLAAWKGKLTFERVPYSAKDDADHPAHWYLLGTRIKCSYGGGYLAYDAAGKDSKTFLATKPGPDTDWRIEGLANDERREEVRGVIRAASGPKKVVGQ